MAPDVRVHVRLGSVRLSFEGERSFYEKHVEALVDGAARRGPVPGSALAPSRNGASHDAEGERAPAASAPAAPSAAAGHGGASSAAISAAPKGDAFVPQSG